MIIEINVDSNHVYGQALDHETARYFELYNELQNHLMKCEEISRELETIAS